MVKFSKITQAALFTLSAAILLTACSTGRHVHHGSPVVERKVVVVPPGPAYGYFKRPPAYRRPPVVVHKHVYHPPAYRKQPGKYAPPPRKGNNGRPERGYRPRR